MQFKVKTVLRGILREISFPFWHLTPFFSVSSGKNRHIYVFRPFSYTKVGILYALFYIFVCFFPLNNVSWRSLQCTENFLILFTATSEFHCMDVIYSTRPLLTNIWVLSSWAAIANRAADLVYMLCVLILCFVIWKDVLGWVPRTVGEGCHQESLGGGTGFVTWCSPRECRTSSAQLRYGQGQHRRNLPQSVGPWAQKAVEAAFPKGQTGAHSWNILPALGLLLSGSPFWNWLLVLWSSSMSFLVVCLLSLSVSDGGVLKSPTLIVDSSIYLWVFCSLNMIRLDVGRDSQVAWRWW